MATNRKGRRNPPPFYLGQHIAQVSSVAKQTGRELKSLDIQTPGNGYCVEVNRKTDVALAINRMGISGEPILFAKLHYSDCALTFRFVPDEQGENLAWRVTEVEA